MYSQTNSQVLSADGETLLRLVTINGVRCWQASTGRTFPQVAGAEDPPTTPKTEDPPKAKDGEGDEGEFDKDRALSTIKKLRDQEKTLKGQLKELDTLKAEQKKRDDAEKSESDRLKEQIADLERKSAAAEQKLTESQNRAAIERAASKAGAADPEDVFRLLNQDDFERSDDGHLTNADDLVKDLLKKKPYLVGKAASATGVPATPRGNGSTGRDEEVNKNREELRASPHYQQIG